MLKKAAPLDRFRFADHPGVIAVRPESKCPGTAIPAGSPRSGQNRHSLTGGSRLRKMKRPES